MGNARQELDNLVVTMELTLISIIQGVALYFLTDSARTALVNLQFSVISYVITALFILLLFWTRSLFHTFTIIRWPLEFGHNFFYIAATLLEATMFTQLANPPNWYGLGAAFSALVWLLYWWDLRLIHLRRHEQKGKYGTFYDLLEQSQLQQAQLIMPATFCFYVIAAVTVHLHPGLHVGFGIAQALGAILSVIYAVWLFDKTTPLILQMRTENE